MEYIEIKMKHFFFFTRLFSEAVSQSREKNIKESAEVQKRERERKKERNTEAFCEHFFPSYIFVNRSLISLQTLSFEVVTTMGITSV